MSYTYSDSPGCCSTASAQLKLYQACIFSIPIFFTLILLFLFYLFYLRRPTVDWPSLRMRATYQSNPRLSDSGLNKEIRELLPIIVFSETFSITDTQCSVCLGDYQADDRLQQIPACGHTFHMDCIDHWLATHATCPLCRLSLIPAAKSDVGPSDNQLVAHAGETQTVITSSDDNNEVERLREEESHGYGVSNEMLCNALCGHSGHESVTVHDVEVHDSARPVLIGLPRDLV